MKLTREALGNYDFIQVEFGPPLRLLTGVRSVQTLLSREMPIWRRLRSLIMWPRPRGGEYW